MPGPMLPMKLQCSADPAALKPLAATAQFCNTCVVVHKYAHIISALCGELEGYREMTPADGMVHYQLAQLRERCFKILTTNGLSGEQAEAVCDVVMAGERDECRSHGVYRISGCVKTMKITAFNRAAVPVVSDAAGAVVRVDAGFGFASLAFQKGVPLLAARAHEFGLAAMAVNNCFHFSALWYEVEEMAKHGLVSLAMNPSLRAVAPHGGTKPLLGTNPMAFGWPRSDREPYVWDFATSEVARGEIELHRQNGKDMPLGWAIDADGQPTTDPTAGLAGAMLTFGGHKGSAISTMIELLAGPLINDSMSFEATHFDGGMGAIPCHGELIIAFSPEKLLGADRAAAFARAEILFGLIGEQGARLPSERRYEARKRSLANGVQISRVQDDILEELLRSTA
jgi:delta1-piperideine-2-carboxylate reductase